jgi:hypothetical protein
MNRAMPCRTLVAVTCLASSAVGCGAPAADTPAAGGSAGASGGGAPVAGSPAAGGSSGAGVSGSASGGNPSATAGTGGATAGQGGTTAGSGGAPQGGQGGGAGMPSETPPEGVPADYTLAISLPFASEADLAAIVAGNQAGWTFNADGGGALAFNGAGYTAPAPVNESLSSFGIISTTKLSSFVLDVELAQMNPDQAQPHRDLCIVFNATDHKHFLYAHIAQTHDERSHNIHLINNAPRDPITVMDNGGIMWGSAGTWHKVRLVRDATSGAISVFWDGNFDAPILTANSTAFTSGYIGFGTFQDSGKVRNLKVWAKAPEAVAAQGFFD